MVESIARREEPFTIRLAAAVKKSKVVFATLALFGCIGLAAKRCGLVSRVAPLGWALLITGGFVVWAEMSGTRARPLCRRSQPPLNAGPQADRPTPEEPAPPPYPYQAAVPPDTEGYYGRTWDEIWEAAFSASAEAEAKYEA